MPVTMKTVWIVSCGLCLHAKAFELMGHRRPGEMRKLVLDQGWRGNKARFVCPPCQAEKREERVTKATSPRSVKPARVPCWVLQRRRRGSSTRWANVRAFGHWVRDEDLDEIRSHLCAFLTDQENVAPNSAPKIVEQMLGKEVYAIGLKEFQLVVLDRYPR